VADLNPDGVITQTRANTHGVDLNRNFPDRWKPLGAAGSLHYAGTRPLSEPESRAAAALIRRLHPTLGIWYHQALDVVDSSQGNPSLERRYAADTGMTLRPLPDYPGSATGYQDALFGPTAFVVELPAGRLTAAQVRRHVHAVLDVVSRSAPVRP
jgi:protein MpaA